MDARLLHPTSLLLAWPAVLQAEMTPRRNFGTSSWTRKTLPARFLLCGGSHIAGEMQEMPRS